MPLCTASTLANVVVLVSGEGFSGVEEVTGVNRVLVDGIHIVPCSKKIDELKKWRPFCRINYSRTPNAS